MIEHCRDFRRVKKLCDWLIDISLQCYYLIEVKNHEDLGVWGFHSYRDGLMVHVNLSSFCRGAQAAESARNAFKWIFSETSIKVIYANIPNSKRYVQTLAYIVGFRLLNEDEDYRNYILRVI